MYALNWYFYYLFTLVDGRAGSRQGLSLRATPPTNVAVGGVGCSGGPSPFQLITETTPGGTSSRPSKKLRISAREWM
jgi:hypothetical protein